MINIRTKTNFLFTFIVVILSITTVIGFVCCEHKCEHKLERIIEIDKETTKETIDEDNRTIKTETDKDGDTNQAIEPVEVEPIFHLTDYERWMAECIVMGESGGELYEGQMAVAQCILNACLKDDIQPSKVRKQYKYSGWNENPTDSVKRAVSAVFDFGEKIVDEPILYFYAPDLCQSKWHETQIFIVEFGGHRFFKEKSL